MLVHFEPKKLIPGIFELLTFSIARMYLKDSTFFPFNQATVNSNAQSVKYKQRDLPDDKFENDFPGVN